MKFFKFFSYIFLLQIYFFSHATVYVSSIDPLLVVVIMVKNEESVIKPTLEPFVKGGVTAFLVFDTGSTDKTMEMAQELFDEYGITNAFILQEPFIDFATSRNRALDLAEEKFPNAGFMLFPDAEWYMHNVEGLIQFCYAHLNYPAVSYLVRIVSPDLDFGTQRLIRCKTGIRFGGVVHETLIYGTHEKVPNEIYFELRPERKGIEKTQKRWLRDKDLLLREFKRNPFDSRNAFYLAQTLECLGELQEAYKYYQIREELPGWNEENFQTYLRLGRVAEQIKLADGECDWPVALGHYLKAYSYRSCRAESLIKIAQYYLRKGDHVLAYLFAVRACQIPYPINDVLFVEKEMYDYTRWDILGQCAWYVQEYENGEKAVTQALMARPEFEHLKTNLRFYLDRKLPKVQEVAVAA